MQLLRPVSYVTSLWKQCLSNLPVTVLMRSLHLVSTVCKQRNKVEVTFIQRKQPVKSIPIFFCNNLMLLTDTSYTEICCHYISSWIAIICASADANEINNAAPMIAKVKEIVFCYFVFTCPVLFSQLLSDPVFIRNAM